MTLPDAERERAANRLRQRLWGAAVLIALGVIVLPLLLDGSGSESQFRRVERLREEPPRIVGERGGAADDAAGGTPGTGPTSEDAPAGSSAGGAPPVVRIGEDDPPDYFRDPPESALSVSNERRRSGDRDAPKAWVVQAGSFRDESNARDVRDQLRRAGFATFVANASETGAPLYRVQVGPVVDEGRAEAARVEVMRLLGREAIVVAWP